MNLYQEYFGFQHPPFSNTPTTSLFSGVGDREKVLSALLSLIRHGDPILKIVGEVGTGKTTIIHNLIDQLQRDETGNQAFSIIFMPSPAMSAQDAFRFIARELGIELNEVTHKSDLFDLIAKKVLDNYIEHDQKTLLIIDEAHTMPPDAIEEVRLLTNIETGDEKLIQIVLVGQPELDEMLEQKAFRQLKSRITHNVYLHDLSPEDTWNYLNVRTRLAGYRGADLFSKKIAKRIHSLSNGKPRLINIIADRALISACADGARKVTARHVKEASQSVDSESVASSKKKSLLLPVAAASLFIVGGIFAAGHATGQFNKGIIDELLAQSQKIYSFSSTGTSKASPSPASASVPDLASANRPEGHMPLKPPSSLKKTEGARITEDQDLVQALNSLSLQTPSDDKGAATFDHHQANLTSEQSELKVKPKKRFWVQTGTFFRLRAQKIIGDGEFPLTSTGPSIWEYQGIYRGKPSKVSIVLYGPFERLAEAREFVNSLPLRIKKHYKPFVLNESDLKAIVPERKVKISMQDGQE